MPPAPSGTITASSGDTLPENAKELLAAFEKGEVAETEAVVEEVISPENPPESPAAESEPAKVEPVRKALAEFTEEELFADARLTGRIGTLVQKQVKKQLADTTAQQARVAKQQQDDALLARDPAAFGRQVQWERAQAQQVAALQEQVFKPLRDDFSELPAAVQKELSGKSYEHLSGAESAIAYSKDRNAALIAYEVARQLDKAVKEAVEAERKKVLTQINGQAPRPDTGAGGSPVARTYTPASMESLPIGEYKAFGKTAQERVEAAMEALRSR